MAAESAAFTPQSFHDLVRLLEQHPEWRAELRRLVLTDDLIELPALVRELIEAQKRTEARVEALAQAQARTEERLEVLAQAQARTEERLEVLAQAQERTEKRVEALAQAQARTEETLQALIQRVDRMDSQLGHLRGDVLELRYREHAGGYFGRLLRRVRVLTPDELDDLLDTALAAGTLAETDVDDLRLADLILRGRARDGGEEAYLVVEVSAGVGAGDVMRAAKRADLLRRIRPTLAAVAGEQITQEARTLALSSNVWQVLSGRVVDPQAA